MELKDRIAALMRHTSLNTPAFAKLIGAKTSQTVYDLLSGKTKTLSSDLLIKMITCFPQISSEWLVTGEGDMYKPSVQQTTTGANSPNMYGSNNNYAVSCQIDAIKAELAELRRLFTRALDMVAKRDEQIDRLIGIIEVKQNES